MTIEEIKEKLNRDDRFCRYNEMRIDVIRPGYAEAVMEITENKLNGLGIAQGGAIFTLADLAFAGASNAAGFRTVAFTSNISFIRPGTGRRLRAVATEVSRGRRTGVYSVQVFNDDGKVVAHGTTTGFISEEKL
ncbi:PaaI family thioesterase [Victivallis vadensis]|uniref:Hotdog fold thioesterase n=1 Tax=Victivallis vadensis TaxID=172901 RepID=A0A848APW0_9BACT|nr:hotdog fold thioesterase [Victivallis vadensis]NMD85894.1 hotdog fold thioesterase [Victivallis vadensis]PWM77390.1 MAG: phenylacetic acid degradation protein [Lentisphaerota bacterium]HJH05575.1 hotdog fold thioesterase [Victivallis vadensis]